jgi:hypothetical protein
MFGWLVKLGSFQSYAQPGSWDFADRMHNDPTLPFAPNFQRRQQNHIMDSIFNIPTSKQAKQAKKERMSDSQLQVQILFHNAHHTVSQIALETGYTPCLAHCLTPQEQKTG